MIVPKFITLLQYLVIPGIYYFFQSTSCLAQSIIQNNDKILILGDRHIFDGYYHQSAIMNTISSYSNQPYDSSQGSGFISLIEKEIKFLYSNITVDTLYHDSDNEETEFNDLHLQLEKYYLNNIGYEPNITIIIYGTQLIHTDKIK